MRRQRRSITDIICENCKYLPTKRSRNKRKPIPKESDVKTFNYTAHLWDMPPAVMSVHRAAWRTAGRRRPGRLSRITMW
ncbi:TPA: NinE family protein [Escherichia coli]